MSRQGSVVTASALMWSAAVIAVPILCGTISFAIAAPPETPGVYAVAKSGSHKLSSFTDHADARDPLAALRGGLVATTTPDRRDTIQALFIVEPRASPITPTVRMFFAVVDRSAGTLVSEPVPLTLDVRRAGPRLVRVMSKHLETWFDLEREYVPTLARVAGPHAAIEGLLLIVVEDQDRSHARVFALRAGPHSVPAPRS